MTIGYKTWSLLTDRAPHANKNTKGSPACKILEYGYSDQE